MRQTRYILIFTIGALLSYAFIVYTMTHEPEMWISWIAVVGIASLLVFLGYEIHSMISK